jgi:hypothetical protein
LYQTRNIYFGLKKFTKNVNRLKSMAPPRRSNSPTSVRLRALRKVRGIATAQAMSVLLGVSLGRYLNFEAAAPLSKEAAILIVQKFPGVTLDYLFLGRVDGMPAALARDLEVAEREILARD